MYDILLDANNFANYSKLSGWSFMYTKKSKCPSIDLCGTTANIGDQVSTDL